MQNIKNALLNTKNKYIIANYDDFSNEDEFLNFVAQKLNSKIDMIQYKFNNKATKEAVNTGRKLRQLCSIYNAILIVFNRLDILKLIKADGIHIDDNSYTLNDILGFCHDDFIIGYSISDKEIIQADYYQTDKDISFKTDKPIYKLNNNIYKKTNRG